MDCDRSGRVSIRESVRVSNCVHVCLIIDTMVYSPNSEKKKQYQRRRKKKNWNSHIKRALWLIKEAEKGVSLRRPLIIISKYIYLILSLLI